MRRRLFTLLAGLSLLLCLASAAAWARSLGHVDAVSRGTEAGDWRLSSLKGRVTFETTTAVGDDPPPPVLAWSFSACAPGADDGLPWAVWSHDADPATGRRTVGVLGVVWAVATQWPDPPASFSPLTVAVPHGLLCAAFALPPAGWAVRRARHRRRRATAGTGFAVSPAAPRA